MFALDPKENGCLAHVRGDAFRGFVFKKSAKLTVILLQECALFCKLLKLLIVRESSRMLAVLTSIMTVLTSFLKELAF